MTPRILRTLFLEVLLTSAVTAAFAHGLPVTIIGPADALPDSGPHTATVQPFMAGVAYQWRIAEGTGILLDVADGASVQFRTGSGAATLLTCEARNPSTGETGSGTHQVLLYPEPPPAPPLLPPPAPAGEVQDGDAGSPNPDRSPSPQAGSAAVRIEDFRCDPPGPLKVDAVGAHLQWTLGRDPETLTLREELTGWERPLAPSDRSFPLAGHLRGRSIFTLTTVITEGSGKATDTQRLTVVVPGVTVLAGDAVAIGAGYLREAPEGVTPWSSVTGLAWKAPWLYFSQGTHHTIRRVPLAGGPIEEVAGMRGIPGTRQKGQDLLFEPGQLVHRTCTPADGLGPTEEWLVLQPKAGCIQAFTEGRVASTMRVLVGPPRAPLDKPSSMAVHGPTGHVFVAELGDRTIKLYAPDGEPIRTVADRVEAYGLAVNDRGDVFFTDPAHHVIRVLRHLGADLNGASTFAPAAVFAGAEGRAGAVDGPRTTQARFRQPRGLALDTSDGDSLLIADTGNHLVRKVRADLTAPEDAVETAGGNPHAIRDAHKPVASHPNGTLATLDGGIRLFPPDGAEVRTLPGSEAWPVSGIALDLEGNLFLSEPDQHVVWVLRLLNPPFGSAPPEYGPLEVFAGRPGSQGMAEGKRTEALFQRPEGLRLDPKDPAFLLITDVGAQVVWRVPVALEEDLPVKRHGKPRQAEGTDSHAGFKDGPAAASQFSHPRQLCGDGHGGSFVQDQTGPGQSSVLRAIDLAGEVRTLGGINLNTTRRTRADGTGTQAGFDRPMGIAVDRSGAVFLADSGNQCVRRIMPDGKVSVWVGTKEDRSPQETCNAKEARFDQLSFLGMDFLDRLHLVEPKRRWLQRVVFTPRSDGPPEGVLTTVRKELESDRVAIFPASTVLGEYYPLVLTQPSGETDEASIRFRSFTHNEVIDPRVKLQALCADRKNRVWVAVATDPAQPGLLRIQRHSCRMPRVSASWDKEGATLILFPPEARNELDGRPYVPCAAPRITAMATDSHHNLFLADSGNGIIWKVDERHFTAAAQVDAERTALLKAADEKENRVHGRPDPVRVAQAMAMAYAGPPCLSRVAGRYPFLGPPGRTLDDPLLPMQGLALTPQDDLVVTCGNAVLRITQAHQEEPAPWLGTEPLGAWKPMAEAKGKVSREAAPKPVGLRNQSLDTAWNLAMDKAEARLLGHRNALLMAQASQRSAALAYQASPASMALMNRAEALLPVIIQTQKAVALAEAELAAQQAAYAWLKARDYPPASRHHPQTLLSLDQAEGNVQQIAFECLRLGWKGEALQASDPRRAALRAEERYFKAVQLAYATEAEALRALMASKPLLEHDEAVLELRRRRDASLRQADREAQAFEASPQGQDLQRFRPWTEGNPPTD